MVDNLVYYNRDLELNMYNCGIESCEPGHYFGPDVRDHYLIHYCLEGKGMYKVDNKCYYLRKNQGFLICPDIVTYYEADNDNPWTYAWIGFRGFKAQEYLHKAGLNMDNPTFYFKNDNSLGTLFLEILQSFQYDKSKEIRLQGLLYIFLSELIENPSRTVDPRKSKERHSWHYTKKAMDFIEKNYSRPITIKQIAGHVGLDRSYLCSIFKETVGASPQQYLINFLMDKACQLMNNPLLSISDIARSVGYNNPLTFSKAFKKTKGVSPRNYRKLHA